MSTPSSASMRRVVRLPTGPSGRALGRGTRGRDEAAEEVVVVVEEEEGASGRRPSPSPPPAAAGAG